MAKIPVEQTSGGGWWKWLLALLLLAGVIWLLAELITEPAEEIEPVATDVEVVEPVEPVTPVGEITSVMTIAEADMPTTLAGREVDLDGLIVEELAGDSTFWAYPPGMEDQRVFVVLEGLGESMDGPGTGADGEYNVDEGERWSLEGSIVDLGTQDPSAWGLRSADAEEVAAKRIYIRARDLSMSEMASN